MFGLSRGPARSHGGVAGGCEIWLFGRERSMNKSPEGAGTFFDLVTRATAGHVRRTKPQM
jgi:hypothetical protein